MWTCGICCQLAVMLRDDGLAQSVVRPLPAAGRGGAARSRATIRPPGPDCRDCGELDPALAGQATGRRRCDGTCPRRLGCGRRRRRRRSDSASTGVRHACRVGHRPARPTRARASTPSTATIAPSRGDDPEDVRSRAPRPRRSPCRSPPPRRTVRATTAAPSVDEPAAAPSPSSIEIESCGDASQRSCDEALDRGDDVVRGRVDRFDAARRAGDRHVERRRRAPPAHRGSRTPPPCTAPRSRHRSRAVLCASWATASRIVLRSERRIVSMSSGASVRGSITSTEMPRSASRSAAVSASSTMPDSATTVTSSPSRATRARPNGIASPDLDLASPPVEPDVLDEEHGVAVEQRASA